MKQWYCHIGNQQYGPVGEDVLQSWVNNGQLRAIDMVWSEGMADWTTASNALPELFRNVASPQGGQSVGGVQQPYGAQASPVQPFTSYGPMGQQALKPHRGGMVLTFGILGMVLCCCIPLSILAWVFGSQDIKEMDAGRMDPSGRGLTQAGRILGIIGTILGVLGWIMNIIGRVTGQPGTYGPGY